jgi:hypothetical protein
MTASKRLPEHPSIESLRKQAKNLARGVAAGDAQSIARARAQLPNAEPALSRRDAQLVLAREYGFAGWRELAAEVHARRGTELEWAASRARALIHDNDVEGLRKLVTECPALLAWRGAESGGGLLGMATGSFGDSFDAVRETDFTRAACAELLIDVGAVVVPSVCDGLIQSRARGLLELFERKGVLPRTLEFLAALGRLDAVRRRFDDGGDDLATVNEAFLSACRLEHSDVAAVLLDRSIELDPSLGEQIDGDLGGQMGSRGAGRAAFIASIIEDRLDFLNAEPAGPWQALVMRRVMRAIHDDDLSAFVATLRGEPWLLEDACVPFQVGLIERATLQDRERFITGLLDLDPALLRRRPPPPTQALEFAYVYTHTALVPMLTCVWPVPDDLPHAAGAGDLARVVGWFDAAGEPALGDLANHFPTNSPFNLGNLRWGEPKVQHVLDTALAWAVLNSHFEIADFLLGHGADVNTNWGSHEPASILHELVSRNDYEAMQFLIDRGIDLTITDYRWRATAQGWAYHAAQDEAMARWLAEAEQRRGGASS